jgi:tripartite-type tricarboxylate transporter receptor subunit TctC
MVYRDWFGFYLPPKTAPDRVQRLNGALVAALAAPEVANALATIGLEAQSSSAAELAAMQRREMEQWEPLVKSIGFSADS